MAQIPMGEFGQARALPRPDGGRANPSATNIAGSGAAALGETLTRVGITGLGKEMERQQAEVAEQEREAEMLARAKAANALAARSLEVEAAVADVGDQIRRGALDYTKAGSAYEEILAKLPAPVVEGLPPAALESFTGGLQNGQRAGRLKVDGLVVAARRDDGQKQFGTLLDTLGKLSGLPGADLEKIHAQADAFVPVAAGFGLDQSMTEEKLRNWKEGNWQAQAYQRLEAGRDDVGTLTQLREDLTAETGAYATRLGADRRAALAMQVGNRIDALENRAAAAKDRSAAAAESALKQMDEQFYSGFPATPEQRAAWVTAVEAAPQYRAEFEARARTEVEVQEFLRQPITVQEATLEQREAQMLRDGADPAMRANHERLAKAVAANVKMLREDPLQYATARLAEKVPPIPMEGLVDPSKGGEVAAALQQRANIVAGLRKQYGPQVAQAILRPEERTALKAALDATGPEQQLALFGRLRQLSGSADTFGAIMTQLAPDAPLLARAGEVSVAGANQSASLLLRGAHLLAGKGDQAVKMPPDKQFTEAFLSAAGNAYQGRPEMLQRDLAAARAVYAASAVQDGDTAAQTALNGNRLENAMRAIVGEFAEVGDSQVVTPLGMPASEFEDKVEAPMRAALQAAGYDPRTLGAAAGEIGLMNGPRPGLYVLIQGRSPVWNPKAERPDGRPVPVYIDLGAR